jgi:hypothetical protein
MVSNTTKSMVSSGSVLITSNSDIDGGGTICFIELHMLPFLSGRLHEPIDAAMVKWDAWASIEVLKEIVSALMFLHDHKILHGDLKVGRALQVAQLVL